MPASPRVIGIDPDDDEPEEALGTDLVAALTRGVRRYRRAVVTIALGGAALGLLWGMSRPDEYSSEARLLLRIGARERVTSESLVGGERDQPVTPPTVNDEIQMLKDVAIFENVARQVGPRAVLERADPTAEDGPLTPWPTRALHAVQGLAFSWSSPVHDCGSDDCPECLALATRVLVRRTVVANEAGSNVIRLTYASTSPARAQQVMQALMSACIERHKAQFSSQGVLEKNRGKLEEAKRSRDEAARAYFEHLANTDFVDLDSQYPACVVEINAIEDQLFAANVRSQEIARQLELLATEGATAAATAGASPRVVPNAQYEAQMALKRELLAQRWNLAFEKLSEDERRLRERDLDAQLIQADQKLASLPMGSVRSPGSPASDRLSVETVAEELKLEEMSLSVKVGMLEQRLSEKRAKLTEITRQGLVEDLVRKDLASAREAKEAAYQNLLQRFSQLEGLVSMDLNDANLQVLGGPSFDREPVGPKRLGLLLNGLLAGLAAACAYAVLRQRSDDRIWQPSAAEEACGVPVLGVVPAAGARRRATGGPVVRT